MELFDKVRSPYLGLTLDMGVYTKRLPRMASVCFMCEGMKELIANYLINGFNNDTLPRTEESGKLNTELADKIIQMGGRVEDILWHAWEHIESMAIPS